MTNKNMMVSFHELVKDITETGNVQFNKRTGHNCYVKVGAQLEFDLSTWKMPILTTRKMYLKPVVGELLGFFGAFTSAKQFRDIGCNVWNANANETPAWLANRHRKGEDDLGRVYGSQWADWRERRFVDRQERDKLILEGFVEVNHDEKKSLYGMEKSINQLENALTTIITNPSDRRIIISGWNVGEMDLMCLPPCHKDYTFIAFEETKTLDIVMTIRSWDTFLGFNIPMTALFLFIMSRLSGYKPGKMVVQCANAHVYDDHLDAVKELLTRDHFEDPTLVLSDNIKPIENIKDVVGAFAKIRSEDIWLENYNSHDPIKVKMAV